MKTFKFILWFITAALWILLVFGAMIYHCQEVIAQAQQIDIDNVPLFLGFIGVSIFTILVVYIEKVFE